MMHLMNGALAFCDCVIRFDLFANHLSVNQTVSVNNANVSAVVDNYMYSCVV